MKITQFNTVTASNVAQKLTLSDPFTGERLIDENGRTLDVYVYGIQSDIARNAIKTRDRKYGKNAKLDEDQAAQSGAEFLAAITQGWSDNIENDEGPIAYSREAAIELYKTQDWIARQVQQFSMDLVNFDPKRLKGAASTSGTSHGSKPSPKNQTKLDGND